MELFCQRLRSHTVSTSSRKWVRRERRGAIVSDSALPLPQIGRVLHEEHECFRKRNYTFSSPATDLAARRGMFSRKHYGSAEILTSCESDHGCDNGRRFKVETGDREAGEVGSPLGSPVHLENPEFETRWYFKYFLGKMHQNYIGLDASKEAFILSVVLTDANNHNIQQYRAILWRKKGVQKICLAYNLNKPISVKGILNAFSLEKIDKGPKEIFSPEIQKELLVLEEQEGSVNFKFGVIYALEGQESDEEMYGNEKSSEEFEEFLDLLGERIKLQSWDRFKGGLDTHDDTTGDESIYTVYEGHEIMFHISTNLPYSEDNRQQVERKRHIGNDIVNIVFMDCDHDLCDNKIRPVFKPSNMKTHFTHIFAVVTHVKLDDSYRLHVYSDASVPLFGPPLPSPPVFKDKTEFRDFLLVKLINAEKATFSVPVFSQKRVRTMDMLIQNLYQDYVPEISKSGMLNRRAFSDIIPEQMHGSRRKEEARQSEFVRIGQSLKLKIILKGDAPTSLVSTSLLKREPWVPRCFVGDLDSEILCGDSWGDKLIVTTENGTFVLEENCPRRLIFDRTVSVKQINVVEAHGLLLLRVEKGKESRVHVFRLSDFEGEYNEDFVRSKNDLKEHKLEKTKGCSFYALSRPGGSHLRMIVAVGKKLQVLTWKHSTAWTAWCQTCDHDTVEGFQFIREIQTPETPQVITLIDGTREEDNQICIGYKNQFDLINERTGDSLSLYNAETNKCNIVSAIDVYEDDETELLLCYNQMCHFQRLKQEKCHEFDFSWNLTPQSIVCAFPYIMAFTPDTIEIRLIINGNLVHTMTFPRLFLITSKCDIYFSSTAQSHLPTSKSNDSGLSPPLSPLLLRNSKPVSVFKIPLTCLVGQIFPDKSVGFSHEPSPVLSPPVTNSTQPLNHGSSIKRSPLLRSQRVEVLANDINLKDMERRGSSSTDSGIHSLMASLSTPPLSPIPLVYSVEEDDALESDTVHL